MNAKQRYKNRATAQVLYCALPPKIGCPNCGEYVHNGHFVPPCFGEDGFYICKPTNNFIFSSGKLNCTVVS